MSASVTDGTRKACGSYRNRVVGRRGERCLDEPTPWRCGRGSQEHLAAALRCLYRHTEDDGLIVEKYDPAHKVD